MFLNFFKRRKRRKLIAEGLDPHTRVVIDRNLRQFEALSGSQQQKLEDCVKIFVAEKHWEGCEGLEVTEEMKTIIAAHASLLLLGATDYYFDGVVTVLIYPSSFRRKVGGRLVVDEQTRSLAGEAWQGGPIILSWTDVVAAARTWNDGFNVVIHEFAHHLDGLDGEMGGNPPFSDPDDDLRWRALMPKEFGKLQHAAEHGLPSLLDYYGATNQAEFFAVASECFIELPLDLREHHPELFELMCKLYKFDPSSWME